MVEQKWIWIIVGMLVVARLVGVLFERLAASSRKRGGPNQTTDETTTAGDYTIHHEDLVERLATFSRKREGSNQTDDETQSDDQNIRDKNHRVVV